MMRRICVDVAKLSTSRALQQYAASCSGRDAATIGCLCAAQTSYVASLAFSTDLKVLCIKSLKPQAGDYAQQQGFTKDTCIHAHAPSISVWLLATLLTGLASYRYSSHFVFCILLLELSTK